jgi:hypothetical protein
MFRMRHRARLTSVLLLAMAAMGAKVVGCADAAPEEYCEGGGCGKSGGAGGHEPPPPNCVPTGGTWNPNDSCKGVFVRAGADAGGDGSKERPFQHFAEAAAANPKRVYVCGEMNGMAETYTENAGVTFSDGVEIYAGFTDCAGTWSWSSEARARLEGPRDAITLTLNGGESRVENLDVFAANATAADGYSPGKSSIALLANGGTLDIVNSSLEAGNATNGSLARTIEDDPMLDGTGGDPGVAVCAPGINHPGPAGPIKSCTDAQSVGGKGGDGGAVTGTVASPTLADAGDGASGKPATSQPTDGARGTGETASQMCAPGKDGAAGALGEPAGRSEGLGTIDAAGYTGALAKPGGIGRLGQGGGGGGGARGGAATCGGTSDILVPGASGGAGGSGGCGGQGGHGGYAGGSSIALVVVDAAVTLDQVRLVAGNAGNGGPGGKGQLGGNGSAGGEPGARSGNAKIGCMGGRGGQGGDGGPGGGGHGGHSLGIAFRGKGLRIINPGSFTPGDAGTGGPGAGTAPNNGASGATGLVQECWDFAKSMPCSTTSR